MMLHYKYRNLTEDQSLASQLFPRDQRVWVQSAYSVCDQFGTLSLVAFSKNFHEHRFANSVVHENNMLHILVRLTIISTLDLQNVSAEHYVQLFPGMVQDRQRLKSYRGIPALGRERGASLLTCLQHGALSSAKEYFKCQIYTFGRSGDEIVVKYPVAALINGGGAAICI